MCPEPDPHAFCIVVDQMGSSVATRQVHMARLAGARVISRLEHIQQGDFTCGHRVVVLAWLVFLCLASGDHPDSIPLPFHKEADSFTNEDLEELCALLGHDVEARTWLSGDDILRLIQHQGTFAGMTAAATENLCTAPMPANYYQQFFTQWMSDADLRKKNNPAITAVNTEDDNGVFETTSPIEA